MIFITWCTVPFFIYQSFKWVEKDSNLRSRRQQIYSLPPLAAREPTHAFISKRVLFYHRELKKSRDFF